MLSGHQRYQRGPESESRHPEVVQKCCVCLRKANEVGSECVCACVVCVCMCCVCVCVVCVCVHVLCVCVVCVCDVCACVVCVCVCAHVCV